jgi:hypothetical protein
MEDQKEHNNTTSTVQILDGDDEAMIAKVATLLGPKFNMPRAGIIRPGIMKLKKGCGAQDEKIYKDMIAEGATWDEIDKRLGNDTKNKSKLIPANVDYFSIRPRDCQNPGAADQIHTLYADKSDGKLRSIPIWFPVNEWWNIIPHSLRCFSQAGIKFKSAFREISNGHKTVVRVCEFPVELEAGQKTFGGRPWEERPCVPEKCAEYQKGECKFGGMLQFYIPKIKGMGIWVLPTTSWYSLVKIKSALEAVAAMTKGRLASLFIDGETPFVLRKVYEEIPRIDLATGKSIRQSQWLIDLDTPGIDMQQLVQQYEEKTMIERGQRAKAIIAGPEDTSKEMPKYHLHHESTEVAGKAKDTVIECKAVTEEKVTEGDFVPETVTVNKEACLALIVEGKRMFNEEFGNKAKIKNKENFMALIKAEADISTTGNFDYDAVEAIVTKFKGIIAKGDHVAE